MPVPHETMQVLQFSTEEWRMYLADLYGIRDGFINSAKIIESDRCINPEILEDKRKFLRKRIEEFQKELDVIDFNLSDAGEQRHDELILKARSFDHKIRVLRELRKHRENLLRIINTKEALHARAD